MTSTSAPEPLSGSFVEEIIDNMLAGWTGLRHYLLNRRAGSPADPVMDSLLTEWVRAQVENGKDVKQIVQFLQSPH